MVELSNERIEQIIKDETKKTEALPMILRAIYNRYMNLYEHYIAEVDTLTDDKVAAYKKQHEETRSLIKYYYMDIPQDVCHELNQFDENCDSVLLGRDWKKHVYDAYDEFKSKSKAWNKEEDYYIAEFKKYALKEFYAAMEEIFRDGFGTGSETSKNFFEGISGLLFGGGGSKGK